MTDSIADVSSQRQRWALLAAAVALVTSFALFTVQQVPLLTFPYAINYGEGVLLDQMRRVTEPPGLYPEFGQQPYVIDNYPPVYPLIARAFPAPQHAPFFGGRLLSLLASLVSAWMIGLVVRRWAGDAAGMLSSATFLALPEVHRFAGLARVDALALAFGLVGFYCILRRDRWLRVLGCAAFFLSIYTRQSMLAVPVVGFLLLLRREGWSAWVWPAGLLVAGIAGYSVLHLATGGRAYDHLIHFNVLQYSWQEVIYRWFGLMYPWRYPLILAAFVALAPLAPKGRFRVTGSFLLYALGALLAAGWLIPVLFQSSLRYFSPPEGEFGVFGIHQDDFRLYDNLEQFHVVMAAVALLAGLRFVLRSEREQDDPSMGWMVLAGFGSAALIGRVGSDVNYLFELCALLCLTAGWGLARGPKWQRRAIAALLATGLVANMTALAWPGKYGDTSPFRLSAISRRTERILSLLRDVKGPILSEDPQLQPLMGKPLEFEVFMHSKLLEAKIWDSAEFARSFREQRWGALVLRWSLVSPDSATLADDAVLIAVRDQAVIPKSFLDQHVLPYYETDRRHQFLESKTRAYGFRWDVMLPRD